MSLRVVNIRPGSNKILSLTHFTDVFTASRLYIYSIHIIWMIEKLKVLPLTNKDTSAKESILMLDRNHKDKVNWIDSILHQKSQNNDIPYNDIAYSWYFWNEILPSYFKGGFKQRFSIWFPQYLAGFPKNVVFSVK